MRKLLPLILLAACGKAPIPQETMSRLEILSPSAETCETLKGDGIFVVEGVLDNKLLFINEGKVFSWFVLTNTITPIDVTTVAIGTFCRVDINEDGSYQITDPVPTNSSGMLGGWWR